MRILKIIGLLFASGAAFAGGFTAPSGADNLGTHVATKTITAPYGINVSSLVIASYPSLGSTVYPSSLTINATAYSDFPGAVWETRINVPLATGTYSSAFTISSSSSGASSAYLSFGATAGTKSATLYSGDGGLVQLIGDSAILYSLNGGSQFATGSGDPYVLTTSTLSIYQQNGSGKTGSALRLRRGNNSSNGVILRAPRTSGPDVVIDFPGGDGISGQAMVTDGAGALSFSTDFSSSSFVSTSTSYIVRIATATAGAYVLKASTFNVDIPSLVTSGGLTGRVICWKTASTLGYCSSGMGPTGDCTCN